MKFPKSLEVMIQAVVESTGITQEENKHRQDYLNLTEHDAAQLNTLQELLHKSKDLLMSAFYKNLLDFPETREFLKDEDKIAKLKAQQWRYLSALTSGKYDWDYVLDRLRVGIVHQQIGLEPKWYIGSYSNYLCAVIDQIHKETKLNDTQLTDAIKALLKIIFLDIGLVLDTYFDADHSEMKKLKEFAENIVCNVPAGLVVLNEHMCVISTNRFVEQFTNESHHDLKGRDIESVLPAMGLRHRIAEVMSNGIPQQGIVFERSDEQGGLEHFEITITLMSNTEQEQSKHTVNSVMVVIEDLSEQEQLRLQTQEADMRVRVIMDNVAEGIITINKVGEVESFNSAAEHLFGYSAGEVIGNNVKMLMPDPYHSKHDGYLQQYLVTNKRQCLGMGYREVEGRKKDGSTFAMELSISDVKIGEQQIFVGMVKDITLRKEQQATTAKLSSALEQTADSIMIVDGTGIIEYVNAGFEQTTGFAREEAIGLSPNILKSGLQDDSFYKNLWGTILSGNVFREVLVNRRKDGEIYYEEKTISPLLDDSGSIIHFVSSGKDITERMQTQERLQYLVHHDVLTDLPNRLLFLERLSQAITQSRRSGKAVVLMFLDLDRFKVINDTLGHQMGDQLLKKLGQRLRKTIRDEDTVARLSGDEFAVLLRDVKESDEAALIARHLLEQVSKPFTIEGRELFLTTSIGISVFPDNGFDPAVMLKNADVAMYNAKTAGRNTYKFYNKKMNELADEWLTLENDLRRALQREEFCLHYQPQVLNTNRQVVGVEALLRWQHPERGLLTPETFISLLEDTGLIVPVGDWVLNKACEQLRNWHEEGINMPQVAVNIAPRQLMDQKFTEKVLKILAVNQLQPTSLELEITESTLMENTEQAVKTLQDLHTTGVSIAMDDFGTGYSSLRYLREFPLRTLKIDRAFVNSLPYSEDDCNLALAIITMGHGMKLKVIAEGVETEEQYNFLKELGCDLTQGFYFSRPLVEEQVANFITKSE